MANFQDFDLLPLSVFGEEIIPSENRELEEMFGLYVLHPEFYKQVFTRDKHWCLDRMQMLRDTDDLDYLEFCGRANAQEIINTEEVANVLVLSEAGVGKTCLLYHLWHLVKQQYKNKDTYIPIYVNAKDVYEAYRALHQNEKESSLEFLSMMKVIATCASKHIISSLENEKIQEALYSALQSDRVFLFVDDLDLLPFHDLPLFLTFFTSSHTILKANKPTECFHGKVVLASRITAFASLADHPTLFQDIRILQLFPGFTFNLNTTSQIRSLLKRWPMIENSNEMKESVSSWIAFESGLRAHQRKLFPSTLHSPFLLFVLARRLAKGSLNEMDQGADSEFNIYQLMEDLFNDCLREQYFGFVPSSILPSSTSLSDDEEPILNVDEQSKALADRENQVEEALQRAKEKFPILHRHDLDIGQLKRLCSLIGFLSHWASSKNVIGKEKKGKFLSQFSFICIQVKFLLGKPNIANLLGFSCSEDGCLELTEEEVKKIVQELFSLLSLFYTLSVDGRARPKHPMIQEFIAAKFLTEPSHFCAAITSFFSSSLPQQGQVDCTLRVFAWNDSYFQTAWYWDGVFQFAGIRRGVAWLVSKMLAGTGYDVVNNQQTVKTKKVTSTIEYYLRNLQSLGVDVEDLGQIRFQILLRVYSSICNHRSMVENHCDPLTEMIGKAFSGLIERSLTVFMHLEVFPNYFLSAFTPDIADSIAKRCISLFTKRPTPNAIHLISLLQYSPYLTDHLVTLLKTYSTSQTKTRLAIFRILQNINEISLDKLNMDSMLQMLGDYEGAIRRNVVTSFVSLGKESVSQISNSLLSELFEGADPTQVISHAVTSFTSLSDITDPSPHGMLYSKFTEVVESLLAQSDPGTRLLAFLCFGSPNFTVSDSEENGIPARKAALYVCATVRNNSAPIPIFANQDSSSDSQKVIGDYCYTVALNTLISRTLGEVAVCWVSSVMEILKFKSYFFHRVSAISFLDLHRDVRSSMFRTLVDTPNYLVADQTFLSLSLAVPASELLCCIPVLLEYIQKHITNTSKDTGVPSFVLIHAIQLFHHIGVHCPQEVSLIPLCDILESKVSETRIISAALDALRDISRCEDPETFHRNSVQEFRALIHVIEISCETPCLYFIAAESIRTLTTFAGEAVEAATLPLLDLLLRSHGAIRQACIYLVDKHADHFQVYISDICELLRHEDSANERSCYVRSAATATLSCLGRRGYANQVMDTLVKGCYLDSTVSPFYVLEEAVRIFSLMPPNTIQDDHVSHIFPLLHHKSNRVTVAVIDTLGCIGAQILYHEENMIAFARCLAHPDCEIRSACENALLRLEGEMKRDALPQGAVDVLLEECMGNEVYYVRQACVYLFKLYGGSTIIRHCEVVSALINDSFACVRIQILRALREFMDHHSVFESIKPALIGLMDCPAASSGVESKVLREAFRLCRESENAALAVQVYASKALNLFFENIQVKKQAVLLLAMVDCLDSEHAQNLVDMLKKEDPKILTEVANVFGRAGLPLARLIPSMFSSMKANDQSVKRKLLRFVNMHKDAVIPYYCEFYQRLISMLSDNDSVVRKKATELLGVVACSLPLDLPGGLSKTVIRTIIESLVEMNLDRNSFVRREASLSLSKIGEFLPQHIPLIHKKLLKFDEDPFGNILVWRLLSFSWGILIQKQPTSSKVTKKSSNK